jgi:hypothetical protein
MGLDDELLGCAQRRPRAVVGHHEQTLGCIRNAIQGRNCDEASRLGEGLDGIPGRELDHNEAVATECQALSAE